MNLGQRIVLQAGGPGSGRHAGGGFAIVTHRTGAIVKGIPTKEAAKVLMNQKKRQRRQLINHDLDIITLHHQKR
jgi:hypothetical protein